MEREFSVCIVCVNVDGIYRGLYIYIYIYIYINKIDLVGCMQLWRIYGGLGQREMVDESVSRLSIFNLVI